MIEVPAGFLVALSGNVTEVVVPAARPTYKFCGMEVTLQFARRPRVFRLEPSKPKGSGVGENVLHFPSSIE